MKTVRFNEGLVTFKLPKDWLEKHYNDGSAVFYRDDSISGTLRVILIDEMNRLSENSRIELQFDSGLHVQEDFPMIEQVKIVDEDDEDMLRYSWFVKVFCDEGKHRIIYFNYTFQAAYENDVAIMMDIDIIRNSVLTAHYSRINPNIDND